MRNKNFSKMSGVSTSTKLSDNLSGVSASKISKENNPYILTGQNKLLSTGLKPKLIFKDINKYSSLTSFRKKKPRYLIQPNLQYYYYLSILNEDLYISEYSREIFRIYKNFVNQNYLDCSMIIMRIVDGIIQKLIENSNKYNNPRNFNTKNDIFDKNLGKINWKCLFDNIVGFEEFWKRRCAVVHGDTTMKFNRSEIVSLCTYLIYTLEICCIKQLQKQRDIIPASKIDGKIPKKFYYKKIMFR